MGSSADNLFPHERIGFEDMSSFEAFRPPPPLTVSQWADSYRYLSSEASAEPGKWRTSRAEYQRGMMDAVKDNERTVIMTSAQIGKTELILNTLGYFIHYEPCPILIVQPTLQMGEDFSKNKLTPMLRDTPAIAKLFTMKARTSDNNILYKKFQNAAILSITGANSPAGLAARSIRVLLCDEIDRYPPSAAKEGDPLLLAIQRTATFWNRRIVLVSTPTVKGHSRIEEAFSQSDQREWSVPCPSCGKYQPYEWERMLYRERTQPVMKCAYCGGEFGEHEWKSGRGEWIAQAESGIPGFHMNAFASAWKTWPELVASYYEAYSGGDEFLKTWINTVLGESYENPEGVIELESLHENCEDYGKLPDGTCALPEEVLVLTCGVDTQDDRLELEVVGWGLGNQSWGVEYKILYGDTSMRDVWSELDGYLAKTWRKASGEELGIALTCIDSAGHNTDTVYRFCKPRTKRRIFPIVGRGSWGAPAVRKPSRNNRYRVPLFTLGVSTLKGTLHQRLLAKKGEGGYCHFPSDKSTGYDEVYFSGLLSERMVTKRINGREVIRWQQRDTKTRNEPLDCRVYAMGAFEIYSPDLRKLSARLKGERPSPSGKKESVKPEKVRPVRRRIIRRGISL